MFTFSHLFRSTLGTMGPLVKGSKDPKGTFDSIGRSRLALALAILGLEPFFRLYNIILGPLVKVSKDP